MPAWPGWAEIQTVFVRGPYGTYDRTIHVVACWIVGFRFVWQVLSAFIAWSVISGFADAAHTGGFLAGLGITSYLRHPARQGSGWHLDPAPPIRLASGQTLEREAEPRHDGLHRGAGVDAQRTIDSQVCEEPFRCSSSSPYAGSWPCSVLPTLRAGSARAVEGVIQDASGRAMPGVWIAREGHKDRIGGTPWWRSGPDGRFRIDDLPAGKLTLRVVPGEASLSSPASKLVETEAGTTDLTIVLDPGPQLFLRIADYVDPEGQPRYARLVWEEPDGRRPVRYAPIRSDGWTRFVRLPADRDLEVWAMAASNRPVHRGGLRTGDEEQRLVPTEGRTIRGRVLPSDPDSLRRIEVVVEAHPRFVVGRARVSADGSFVVSGLPEGTYRVSAAFTSGAVSLPVVQELATGTTDAVFDLRR